MANILHISRTMGLGGAEKIVYELSTDIKDNKHTIASSGGMLVTSLEEKNVEHVHIPDLDSKNPVNIIKTYSTLSRLVKRKNINIIHSHHRMAAFYARLLTRKYKGLKSVYTAHNIFSNRRKLTKFSLKNTQIVAVSNTVKENLTDFFGIDEKNITVIYNAVKKTDRNNRNKQLEELKKDGKTLVGIIGRVSSEKGHDVFIEAMANILRKKNDVVGIVVGDGPDIDHIKQLARSRGVEKNILFMGYQKDVPAILSQLDIVTMPSRYEGLPLVAIESFISHKVVIASNIENIAEIIKDGESGLLFKKDDASSLAEKAIFVLEHKTLKERIENAAYKKYLSDFSYDKFINQYYNIYKKLSYNHG